MKDKTKFTQIAISISPQTKAAMEIEAGKFEMPVSCFVKMLFRLWQHGPEADNVKRYLTLSNKE